MNILVHLEKKKEYWFLLITACIFFFLRLPSLFEPYWYGDEGIYEAIGLALSKGRFLYKDIWDNKPPFLYILYGLFAGDQFALRLASLITGILSIFVFYAIARKLLTHNNVFFATSVFALLSGIPLLEGNIANAENFMILPILISGYIILQNTSRINSRSLFIAGLIVAVSFLFKVVALFDFAAFACYLFIIEFKNLSQLFLYIKKLLPFGIGFILPILATAVYFWTYGAFWEFYTGSFTQNVGYVGYGNQFIIPQGLLIVKLLILGGALLVFLIKKAQISKSMIFIGVWLSFSLFNAFFSQRPYTHYLLVLLPSFSLFLATFNLKKLTTQVKQIVILFLLIGLLYKNFDIYFKVVPYYQNFLTFITNNKSITAYQEFFDKKTPMDYQLAEFISMHTQEKDEIFIWGNNAQVYKLTNKLPPGRFTVMYHITMSPANIEETKKALLDKKPRLIVSTDYNYPLPNIFLGYRQKYILNRFVIYEHTF